MSDTKPKKLKEEGQSKVLPIILGIFFVLFAVGMYYFDSGGNLSSSRVNAPRVNAPRVNAPNNLGR